MTPSPSSPPARAKSSVEQGLAGGIAGAASVVLLHPLDVVKVRMQVQGHRDPGTLQTARQYYYTSTPQALSAIARSEGYRALYAGVAPAVVGGTLAWGTYFAAYEACKGVWRRSTTSSTLTKSHDARDQSTAPRLSPAAHLACAAVAGAAVCGVTNPLWVVKTRLQLQSSGSGGGGGAATGGVPYRGLFHGLRSLLMEEGVRGCYSGLAPNLVLVSHGALQFMAYEELKHWCGGGRSQITPLEAGAAGMASKLFASVTTYPNQVLRSRMQQRRSVGSESLTLGGTAAALWRAEGLRGFYRGIGPSVLRVLPASGVTFLVYESVLGAIEQISCPSSTATTSSVSV